MFLHASFWVRGLFTPRTGIPFQRILFDMETCGAPWLLRVLHGFEVFLALGYKSVVPSIYDSDCLCLCER